MAKKKKRRKGASSSQSYGRYVTAVSQGKELLNRYWSNDRMLRRGRYEKIYRHYSRESIQRAMFEYARGRKITALRQFRAMFSELKRPEDILPLAFYFAGKGKLWPSLHGTISRNVNGVRLLDLVLEVDFKPNWRIAFQSARPLVNFLRDFGVDFKVKYSGHSSPHIIVPAEAFPDGIGHGIHLQILDYASKHVQGRAHLDMSFRNTGHFLRLAYSINENAGRVSVPIDPDLYEKFSPTQHAEIGRVKILKNWWAVSEDAPERTSEMIRFILERKTISIPGKAKPKELRKIQAKQFQRIPAQLLIAAGPKARQEALRKLQMPYQQMLKTGQQLFQQRDELMEKPNVREAMDMLKTIHERAGMVSTQEAAIKHEVDPEDLWFLWRWTLRENIFHYYAREDVQEAMFLHSIDRNIKLGSEDVVVELSDPGDIPLLAAYIHETQGGVDYPSFYCTNTKRDVTTGDIIDCDVVVRIDGRGNAASAGRMTRWAISLLRQAGADFAIVVGAESLDQASSIQNPVSNIIIPSEAVPGMPRDEAGFVRVIETMEKHFKKALPRSQGISVLPMGEYIPLFYSINEISGSANIPVRLDELNIEDIQPRAIAELNDVQVMDNWWDIPGEASADMEELFKKAAKVSERV